MRPLIEADWPSELIIHDSVDGRRMGPSPTIITEKNNSDGNTHLEIRAILVCAPLSGFCVTCLRVNGGGCWAVPSTLWLVR
jgi:hypothetical protein